MAKSDALELFNRFETSIRSGLFKPVYFIYGKEQYLIDRSQKLVIEQALTPEQRDFNLSILYGGDVEAQAVLALCASYPTMAERRVVIVREFEELSGNDRFVAYVKNPNPQTVLMLISGAGVQSNPYAAISKAAETFNYESVFSNRIPGWIERSIRERGYNVDDRAVDRLASLTASDLQTLSNEIDKLVSFVGERNAIGPDDVLKVAGHSSDFNIFELQDRIMEGDFEKSEDVLNRMLQVSSNTRGTALMTVTILASYFTKLMKLSGLKSDRLRRDEIAKKIGAPAFTVNEYKASLKTVGTEGIRRAGLALLAADFELKGGTDRGESLILTLLLRRLTEGMTRNIQRAAA